MKKFFSTSQSDYGMLTLRVCIGLAMLPYGLSKIGFMGQGSVSGTVQFMSGMGIPAIIAYLVILAETVGCVALILGFCTRFCAASLAVVMAGAVYFMFGNGYMMGYATPLLFLIAYIPLVINGAGAYSMDPMLSAKCSK